MLYPSIECLFERYPKGHPLQLRVDVTKLRKPEFNCIATWLVTEKIDGMNIAVNYESKLVESHEEPSVQFHGRTERAELPSDLVALLNKLFTVETMEKALLYKEKLPHNATLFLEAYGAGIQKGGSYSKTKNVRLFDVVVDGVWLNWDSVVDIAYKLGIRTVPLLARSWSVDRVIQMVHNYDNPQCSVVAREENKQNALAEGVVARTDPLLFDRLGKRLVWKLKRIDFEAGAESD